MPDEPTTFTVWTMTCRGCGWLVGIGARAHDPEEIDVDGKPCNLPFAMQPGPHCSAGARLPLPFLWSVRTNVEAK